MIAILAVRSSSTTRTGFVDDDFEAASLRAGADEPDVSAELARQASADGQTHPESFAGISFMVVHLIELVKEIWNAVEGDSDARVVNPDAG